MMNIDKAGDDFSVNPPTKCLSVTKSHFCAAGRKRLMACAGGLFFFACSIASAQVAGGSFAVGGPTAGTFGSGGNLSTSSGFVGAGNLGAGGTTSGFAAPGYAAPGYPGAGYPGSPAAGSPVMGNSSFGPTLAPVADPGVTYTDPAYAAQGTYVPSYSAGSQAGSGANFAPGSAGVTANGVAGRLPSPTLPGPQYQSGYASGAKYYQPGGYDARIGSPYYYDGNARGTITGDPYYDHFGPGFQRSNVHGHYRFPYYSYRAPWYYPGRAVYNRDTNFAW